MSGQNPNRGRRQSVITKTRLIGWLADLPFFDCPVLAANTQLSHSVAKIMAGLDDDALVPKEREKESLPDFAITRVKDLRVADLYLANERRQILTVNVVEHEDGLVLLRVPAKRELPQVLVHERVWGLSQILFAIA